jgi:hypothetical protein
MTIQPANTVDMTEVVRTYQKPGFTKAILSSAPEELECQYVLRSYQPFTQKW